MMKRNTKEKPCPHIPEGGTLGILAYGYRGIMLWREERLRLQKERAAKIENAKTERQ